LKKKLYIRWPTRANPGGDLVLAARTDEVVVARNRLREIIQKRALVLAEPEKEFVLASGERSRFYFNMKKVTMERDAGQLIVTCVLPLLPVGVDQVGGLETGAVPIIEALVLHPSGPRHGFFVRKQEKQHGLKEKIEGNFDPGKTSVIVDDVTTTGESVMEAIRAVQAMGGRVSMVVAVVNRESGGSEKSQKLGIPYQAVFSLSDFDI